LGVLFLQMANIEFDLVAMLEERRKRLPTPKPLTLDQQRGRLGSYKTAQELGLPIATTVSPPVRIGSHLVAPQVGK